METRIGEEQSSAEAVFLNVKSSTKPCDFQKLGCIFARRPVTQCIVMSWNRISSPLSINFNVPELHYCLTANLSSQLKNM